MEHKLLQVHIRESDRYGAQPLYEAIVAKCRELEMAGATVFRGLEGYGAAADIVRGGVFGHDLPVVVMVVDSGDKIGRLAAAIEGMLDKGIMAIETVSARRVSKPPVLQ